MATTSIWRVKGWIGKVVIYAENPDKTRNPKYFEKQDMTDDGANILSDVIDYAVNDEKTKNKNAILHDETTPVLKQFVSGVNCLPENARSAMMKVKKENGKEGGVVAYHGYQSFDKGEVTPEQCHDIGIKLAEKLWGDRFQVLVTTHLDKAHHLHNHFVLNTVSFKDGKKYYRSEKDYYNMRIESDNLCREYNLSVIENPKRGKSKHYAEWKAEKENKPTWRSLIKDDIDIAISQAMTKRQFFQNLKKMGYEIKIGKDISVKPQGKERFVRLAKSFGEDYTIDGIRKQILSQTHTVGMEVEPQPKSQAVKLQGTFKGVKKITGYRALYFHYLYKMGILPKDKQKSPKQVYFLYREDIRKLNKFSDETRLLCEYKIDTAEQLFDFSKSLQTEINTLTENRKHLRYKSRNIRDDDKLTAVKSEISDISKTLGKLRKQVKLCKGIEIRSSEMKYKMRQERIDREENANESLRGRSRTNRKIKS